MRSLVTACRLSIYLGNADVLHHRAISGEILRPGPTARALDQIAVDTAETSPGDDEM